MANIILAHGILGFGTLIGLESRYFNGVAKAYRLQGHDVLVPTVDLLGSLDLRSDQLLKAINDNWPTRNDLIVIAHSMGGLDIRRAVSKSNALASRVKAIVAIGTPHFGSPVADAVLSPDHPLKPHVPVWLLGALGDHAGALTDLRTRSDLHDQDVDGIRYYEIGCDCISLSTTSPLFALAQEIGRLAPAGNDGVVTLSSSAVPGRPLAETWPTDHCGAIGWPTGKLFLEAISAALEPPIEHITRYNKLLLSVLQ